MKKLFFLLLASAFIFFPQPASKSSAAEEQSYFYKNNSSRFESHEALVKLKPEEQIQDLSRGENLIVTPLATPSGDNQILLVKSFEQEPTSKIIRDLRKNPAVEIVQPNYRYKPLGRITNDAYYSREWWLFDVENTAGGLGASSAWELEGKKQRRVAVAVIDSGANMKHKDLKDNLTGGSAKGKNFENPKRKPTDDDGHGTFISGLIAARSSNRRGIAGSSLYNNLKIMPLRFDFTTSQAIEAINQAKAKNVPVINASWGGYGDDGFDLLLEDAVSQFPGIFVAASGNNGLDHDGGNPSEKMYPCDFDLPNIICAGASDRNGNLADYSDYGATSIDVAAPGGTEDNPLIGLAASKSRYSQAVGSSLSAAFVSAEAGLLFSKYPNLSAAQAIEIIISAVDTNPSLAGKVLTGGKINFQKALQLASTY